ncbi:uncharacterized protein N7484_010160 [Penicillium longicatenatum]|uniref:uncharacterized protein n=1 Tax=Penicillium longicatenatum TaxID=1561947 RepID=UPI0025465932|nr:uncharacterized protein N7484_010160 [Penicillium longicatenatum]KAJ5636847.1 hypothetical protein N7484_010160 [Penicillium longicatenatum]
MAIHGCRPPTAREAQGMSEARCPRGKQTMYKREIGKSTEHRTDPVWTFNLRKAGQASQAKTKKRHGRKD